MNFNIYVPKKIGMRLNNLAKSSHRSRNSIINEALEAWLAKECKTKWPKNFFDFEAFEDFPEVNELRKDLKDNISEDPLQ